MKAIKLIELLHSISTENKTGLVNIDDWRWPDVDHLVTMGFEFGDDHHMITTKEPKIVVYKKKDLEEKTGKQKEYFFIEEPKRGTKKFPTFNEVIDYFDKYSQPDLDKNS